MVYDTYRKISEENQAKGIEIFLMDSYLIHGRFHQLEEAYKIKRKVSSGTADFIHKSAQECQPFEANFQTKGKNFSKRLKFSFSNLISRPYIYFS